MHCHALYLIRHLPLLCQIDVIPTLHLVCAVVNQPQRQLGARPKVRESDFYPYLLEPALHRSFYFETLTQVFLKAHTTVKSCRLLKVSFVLK